MFKFVYEDNDVEINIIDKYLKNNNVNKISNGLMILSGGETMFEIAKYFDNLIAVDVNKDQIDLVNKKISCMNTDKYLELLESTHCTYDKLFNSIKTKNDFDIIFSNENLIKHFGESAVVHTNKSFSDHFKNIYDGHGEYYDLIFNNNFNKINKTYDLDSIKNVEIKHDNIFNLLDKKYDFIHTSNITDWMSEKEFNIFCDKIKNALNKNGVVIMRRLLSNNILNNKFSNCIHHHDKTNFYEEVIEYMNYR